MFNYKSRPVQVLTKTANAKKEGHLRWKEKKKLKQIPSSVIGHRPFCNHNPRPAATFTKYTLVLQTGKHNIKYLKSRQCGKEIKKAQLNSRSVGNKTFLMKDF